MIRVVLGGLLGGVVMFIWGAVSHMLLPTGHMGLKPLPNEDALMDSLKTSIREPGLYMFPGMDMTKTPSDAEQKAWEAKHALGPTGLVLYDPKGGEAMSPRQLCTEFISNFVAAMFGALVLSKISGYGGRVIAATFIGVIAWMSISVSHWNWYGFPSEFITTEAIDQVGGWLLTGLAIAGFVKPTIPFEYAERTVSA